MIAAVSLNDESIAALAWALGLVVLFGFVAWKLSQRRRSAKKSEPQNVLPEEPRTIEPAAVSPGEAGTADPFLERAEAKRSTRLRLEQEAVGKSAAERSALDAEIRQLKEEEEDARKASYRASKATAANEKERKRLAREETIREKARAAEEARRAVEIAEEERREASRKKIEAEAGQTLAAGLAKTRSEGFMAKLNGLFSSPKAIDDKTLAELEEVLFTADIGVKTASRLVELAREKAKSKELDRSDKLKEVIRREIEKIVDLPVSHRLKGGGPPHVIMVVGVNGAGKTTTIGKLAAKAGALGQKVVLGAGDTFRAAAAEQLDVWAERANATLVKGKEDADPASVVFEAVKQAVASNADLVIADTAGRLHTKTNLMEELKKVHRVISKALAGAPHEVLLVLDATNGQNAIAQARQFHDAVGVTGIALTKLDGTAKGGVIIGICDELKVPVLWAGVGEKVSDLKEFSPKEFVAALFD